jgi:hypothetical protein
MALGLGVLALTNKQPNTMIHRHWRDDLFRTGADPARVRGAFTHPATTGIGIATDYPYMVVDIDGEVGAQAWKRMVGDDFIPDRWVAKTAHGFHLWFADETRRAPRTLAERLDLKSDGGYVAAPPSLHPGYPDEGIPPGPHYQWLIAPTAETPPLEVPPGLREVLDDGDEQRRQAIISAESQRHVVHPSLENGVFWSTQVSLAGPIRRMRDTKPGERNAVLHWAAIAILRDGGREQEIEELGEAAAEAGLSVTEIRQTIRSAYKTAAARG